jgi:hypothetical protein
MVDFVDLYRENPGAYTPRSTKNLIRYGISLSVGLAVGYMISKDILPERANFNSFNIDSIRALTSPLVGLVSGAIPCLGTEVLLRGLRLKD